VVAALGSSGIILFSLTEAAEDSKGAHVVAYYFHGQMRCPTCHKLEQYSKEAIEANFKDAIASGRLEYKVVNVEAKGNEHYVKDYELYTKALVLSYIKNGKETRSKNLDKIWEYARDKKKFISYVAEGTRRFMEDSQ